MLLGRRFFLGFVHGSAGTRLGSRPAILGLTIRSSRLGIARPLFTAHWPVPIAVASVGPTIVPVATTVRLSGRGAALPVSIATPVTIAPVAIPSVPIPPVPIPVIAIPVVAEVEPRAAIPIPVAEIAVAASVAVLAAPLPFLTHLLFAPDLVHPTVAIALLRPPVAVALFGEV